MIKRESREPEPVSIQGALVLGSLVQYYIDGWRYGYLDSIKGKIATIRPIAGYKGSKPNCVKVPLDDVKAIEATQL